MGEMVKKLLAGFSGFHAGWLALVLLLGVVLVGYGNLVAPKGDPGGASGIPPAGQGSPAAAGRDGAAMNGEDQLEARVADMLAQIAGAGTVKVRITLAGGPGYEYARNDKRSQRTIEEKDQGGGNRLTTETTAEGQLVILRSQTGAGDTPVVVKETRPAIQGVLVVADGAADPKVKFELNRAVETLLGIAPHRVTVLVRAKEAQR